MNRLRQVWVWITRIKHCRGFGIQSPTDYRFERYVINEQWPYYNYDTMGKGDGWLQKKLGRLYFRVANYRQPATVITLVGAEEYIKAACPKAEILTRKATTIEQIKIDLAIVPIQTEYQQLFRWCDDNSIVIFENIYQQPALWHCIEYDQRTSVTFDLYYCGIVFFNKQQSKNNYIINF